MTNFARCIQEFLETGKIYVVLEFTASIVTFPGWLYIKWLREGRIPPGRVYLTESQANARAARQLRMS